MSGLLISLQGAVIQGLFWGVMALGVYITYKILNIADLTVDGSFTLGACVSTILVFNGVNPFLALVIAAIAGAMAGFITGFLHTFLGIPAILAGILTQISLWSINLRIMGKPNQALLRVDTITTKVMKVLPFAENEVKLIIGGTVVVIIIIALYWFFGTEIGSTIRATGNNEDMIRALGVNTNHIKVLALMLSNALVALSGGLISQHTKSGDINAGTGAIVIGLASIVIGSVLLGFLKSFSGKLVSVVVGSIAYYAIYTIAIRLGLDSSDMKMVSAIIMALALGIPYMGEKLRTNISK